MAQNFKKHNQASVLDFITFRKKKIYVMSLHNCMTMNFFINLYLRIIIIFYIKIISSVDSEESVSNFINIFLHEL